MPVIEFAEESLFSWLDQNYPRITERYNRADMVSRRKLFMQENPAYSVNMTLMRYEFLSHLAKESDYEADAVAKQGFDIFFHARQQVTFYDDVMPCLQRLKQSYRLGSISNGNASVEHVGLGHIFEHSVSASDMNIAKPDRRIFDKLADHFETAPERILYVGDHPEYDVVAPEQAGMQAAWINRDNIDWPSQLPEPKFQVNNLQELEVLLSKYR